MHGLYLRPGRRSIHTLYAIHYGTRESVEVFEVDGRVQPPGVTWVTSRQSSFVRRSPAFEPGRPDGRRPVTEIRRAPRRRAEATVLARTGWRQLLP